MLALSFTRLGAMVRSLPNDFVSDEVRLFLAMAATAFRLGLGPALALRAGAVVDLRFRGVAPLALAGRIHAADLLLAFLGHALWRRTTRAS